VNQQLANPDMTPLDINIEVGERCVRGFLFHSSVNSGLLKQFSTLLTNFKD